MRGNVPEEYAAVLGLAPFPAGSWKEWEEQLWVLVKLHNPGLLDELRCAAERKEVVWTVRKGRQVKGRKLYWKDFRTPFSNHLRRLAEVLGGKAVGEVEVAT
jgi:hypothetical protein